ncbi:glycolipid transfer protein domain-containing protein [Phakopsora pachyrhizi]|uniref:Glycolipid transfer protein domain-containing protein n=1 Tax=Phakopsora pachyrhizi TaxID=170000 RepID=A0AAV0AQ84_PHAPC|nr:glycolipid transfer protein domain-containing protein [Phakopsora pachyrhizi]CAH7669791.1 glycolipid transfer protein domain-containing protein [Phakopsora pachyrhizi]
MTEVCYFDKMKRSFDKVLITEQGIDTLTFLEASDELVKLFDLFESKAFNVVQSDLTGNITKIRTRYESHQSVSNTLESLVEGEKDEKKRDATQGLLWLTRGLHFTHEGLRHSQKNPTDELSVSFTKGYENTLKPHHSFVVRPVFGLAMKACPYRADLFKKLGTKERVDVELDKWLTGLDSIVSRIQKFYEKGNYGKGL